MKLIKQFSLGDRVLVGNSPGVIKAFYEAEDGFAAVVELDGGEEEIRAYVINLVKEEDIR